MKQSGQARLSPVQAALAVEQGLWEVSVRPTSDEAPAGQGYCRGLGQRGLVVLGCPLYRCGSLLVLHIATPLGALRATARVVHCIAGYGVGCSFVGLDHKRRQLLYQLKRDSHLPPVEIRG